MRLGVTSLSLTAGGQPPEARRITGNRGCNLWIGGIVLNADAATFRELARVASEAAEIEEQCDALKAAPHPYEPWAAITTDSMGCRFCNEPRSHAVHQVTKPDARPVSTGGTP